MFIATFIDHFNSDPYLQLHPMVADPDGGRRQQ
jgi:hypothetical protein